jgi:hypothetical protein
MSSALDTYFAGRVAKIQGLIDAYDAAILALASGAQSYELDAGPGAQRVRKTVADLSALRRTRESLLNELSTLDARVNGASTHITPGF